VGVQPVPDEPASRSALRVGAIFANVAGACLVLLGLVMGGGAFATGSLWIAIAAAGAFGLVAAAFVVAGRWLRQGRRMGAVMLGLLTLLLGVGVVKGDITMALPFLPAMGATLIALRSWRQLAGPASRGTA